MGWNFVDRVNLQEFPFCCQRKHFLKKKGYLLQNYLCSLSWKSFISIFSLFLIFSCQEKQVCKVGNPYPVQPNYRIFWLVQKDLSPQPFGDYMADWRKLHLYLDSLGSRWVYLLNICLFHCGGLCAKSSSAHHWCLSNHLSADIIWRTLWDVPECF